MGEPPGVFALPRKDLLPAPAYSYYMKEQTNKQTHPKRGNWVPPTPNLGNLDLGVKFFPWVFFFFFFNFIYLFLAVRGLHCYMGFSLVFGEQGLLSSGGTRASH